MTSSPSQEVVDAMEAPLLNTQDTDGFNEHNVNQITQVSPTLPVRRYGRVLHYDSRPNEHYGFIEELGVWGPGEVVTERIYFHVTHIRHLSISVPRSLVKLCEGDIVEYVLNTHKHDDQTSYRAADITGLHEGYLPFHKGVVTFTPYHVALRKMARQDVKAGQTHFKAVHQLEVDKEQRLKPSFRDMGDE